MIYVGAVANVQYSITANESIAEEQDLKKDSLEESQVVDWDFDGILRRIEELIGSGEIGQVDHLLEKQLPGNQLLLLSRMSRESRNLLFLGLNSEKAADYLHDLPASQALGLLENLEPRLAADILGKLPKDELADFVGELSPRTQEVVLSELGNELAGQVRKLIGYKDDEAGGIMIVEYVSVPSIWTVGDVTRKLQEGSAIYSDYDVQYIYVVEQESKNHSDKLIGVLRLRDLIMSRAETPIASLMIPDPLSVNVHDELKDLNQFFVAHQFLGAPVVSDEGLILGVLRRSDVEKTMAERYAEDYMKSQGIVDEELRTMPLGLRSRRRLAWLSINILLNLVAASVIAFYQETLEQVIALAVFLPIISDMSGCSGNQAVAVSMRELSLGLVRPIEVGRVWLKEIGVGLINGLFLGLLVGIVAVLWKGNPFLGVVVGSAMMVNTLIAVSLGGTLPMILKLIKVDPALASGPILTTVTDLCGFLLVLGIASVMLEKLV